MQARFYGRSMVLEIELLIEYLNSIFEGLNGAVLELHLNQT